MKSNYPPPSSVVHVSLKILYLTAEHYTPEVCNIFTESVKFYDYPGWHSWLKVFPFFARSWEDCDNPIKIHPQLKPYTSWLLPPVKVWCSTLLWVWCVWTRYSHTATEFTFCKHFELISIENSVVALTWDHCACWQSRGIEISYIV
jgi:hypothetical protein